MNSASRCGCVVREGDDTEAAAAAPVTQRHLKLLALNEQVLEMWL